ncbi:MAG: GxxExxY protein [Gammaproteobacteria bacterium]|nr:GxxExxY protein [Gammaproteobacteria bacterium]
MDATELNSITDRIIRCGIEVHKQLGPGLLESSYEACMVYELGHAGLTVGRQLELPIRYKDIELTCGYRIDLLVEDAVIVELKAVEKLQPIHDAQLISYLRLSGKRLGLLMNFNERYLKNGIKRRIYNIDMHTTDVTP